MRIAIFTTFQGSLEAYSLNYVVQDQIKMFRQNGYNPVVLVAQGFKPVENYVDCEIRYIPNVHLSNDGNLPPNYQDDVNKMYTALVDVLHDINVVITHDIIYQPAHYIHNLASRKLVESRPDIRWLHWIHSATSPNVLCNIKEVKALVRTNFPNSFICYPNSYDVPRVSKNFGYEERNIKVVPHPIDIENYFGFHQITRDLIKKYDLLTADVVMTYPVRLDRGKQVEKNIGVMGAIKSKGKTVRLLVGDFHSTGGDKVVYREELKKIGVKAGLNDHELIFISEFQHRTRSSCPRDVIKDLMLISNVFVLPSKSETYSLIAQEAALSANVLVLNFDFTPMRSIYGDDPRYFKFSSNIDIFNGMDGDTETTYHDYNGNDDNGRTFYNEIANTVLGELKNNRVLSMRDKIRKDRNLNSVFKNYLEPLIYYTN